MIDASSIQSIEIGLASIVAAKGVGETYEDALNWFSGQTSSWLLLLDNADDPSFSLGDYIPKCTGGNVIVTTRNQECVLLGVGLQSTSHVYEMTEHDALDLLSQVSRGGVSGEACIKLVEVRALA